MFQWEILMQLLMLKMYRIFLLKLVGPKMEIISFIQEK